ncbi:crotonobetainyl-CoA--carnitine CoA-transferase [Umezawaea sp. NPDC059074]|uniref:crotonobetainyl-CoA--carnitine CoA-transferase n=1 Tax=Umezawaea sp. NPDC059074 TaxID=3346716 RepID=UPI0036743678
MARGLRSTADFDAVMRSYVEGHPQLSGTSVEQLAAPKLTVDERFCRDMADLFDRAPMLDWTDDLVERYEMFKRENLKQYRVIRAEGLDVRPWNAPRGPYRDSRHLVRSVRETGVLRVHLTSAGHGPGPATGFHPLRTPSGVVEHGVELTHNDVFRVVHDVFGHVVRGNGFGPRGEFRAARAHLAMYPAAVGPVLVVEQVAQICWFFYGPHLRVDGRLPTRGEPGYTPPDRRPYAEQKVFPLERHHVARFLGQFKEEHG